MTQVVDLSMAFDGKQSEELTKVVIMMAAGNGEQPATITLPNGLEWTDFEEVHFNGAYLTVDRVVNSVVVPQEWFKRQTDWRAQIRMSDAATTQGLLVTGQNAITATVVYEGDGALSSIIGYKKKYTTTNLTKVLQVNGGNDITTNARYEIPASALPANFLDKNGNIKKNVEVRAEIFNNSGQGIADWFTPRVGDFYTSNDQTLYSYGVEADAIGGYIYVTTAGYGSTHSGPKTSNLSRDSVTNKIQATSINSAPCQVIATLSGEAYTVQTA